MDLYTLDFETYYTKEYSLSRLNTEEYVRDGRFQAILLGVKKNGKRCGVLKGPDEIAYGLRHLRPTLEASAMLAHHAHFDGLILSHHYGVKPARWYDTLSMSRALYGANGGNSLAALAKRCGVGTKGDEVLSAIGKRYEDFTSEELARYAVYCAGDVDLTYDILVGHLLPGFPKRELRLIDRVIRMFTEPTLLLESDLLDRYVASLQQDREHLLERCGVDRAQLMSNPKFAELLRKFGVEPPTKTSPTTGKETFAFAKTDEGMKALQEHDDEEVQLLVAARLGNKSTINETRSIRMANMGRRGAAPVYLKYSGAGQTHRLSGGDKMNWQNLSKTRKPKPEDAGRMVVTPEGVMDASDALTRWGAKELHLFGLRDSITVPDGKMLVVVDSSNIESRVLDMLAGQRDAVQRYVDKQDPYLHLASQIYGKVLNKKDHPNERQLGKVCLLEGTLVLTDHGEIPIEQVTTRHRVWDGVEWVTHAGAVCNGTRKVIQYDTLTATPDHIVYLRDGRSCRLDQAAEAAHPLAVTGHGGAAIRVGEDFDRSRISPKQGRSACTDADARHTDATSGGALCGQYPTEPVLEGADRAGSRGAMGEAFMQTEGRVWDILNAGPRHRFTAGGRLVSNCKLGLGFGMGVTKFHATAKNWGLSIDDTMAQRAVDVYRSTHYMIPALWKRAEKCFKYMVAGIEVPIDDAGVVHTVKDGIRLPNGLVIRYPDLRKGEDGWSYWGGKFRVNIYGGKCVENIVQALARVIVGDQLLEISTRYWVAHFVHDEVVLVVDEGQEQAALAYSLQVMSTSPTWWPGLPLAAEGDVGKNYGGCK